MIFRGSPRGLAAFILRKTGLKKPVTIGMREGESGDCSEEKWDARVHQMCPLGVFGKRPNEHAFFWLSMEPTRHRDNL